MITVTCTWRCAEGDLPYYESSCGEDFVSYSDYDAPEDYMNYCFACGLPIIFENTSGDLKND